MLEFIIFWIASTIGAIAIIPYQFSLLAKKIEEEKIKRPEKKVPSTTILVLLTVLQSAILFAAASYIGTIVAPKVDLHWWLLDHWLEGSIVPYSITIAIIISIAIGLLSTIIILALDSLFMRKMPSFPIDQPSKGKALLASLYGGISEEVLTRLFLMSLIVYFLSFFSLKDSSYWIAIIISAIVFGAGHLPAAFSIIGKTQIVMIRTVLLNAIPGLFFGYLYWQYSIEIAMLAHFSADIFLHVLIGPLWRRMFHVR